MNRKCKEFGEGHGFGFLLYPTRPYPALSDWRKMFWTNFQPITITIRLTGRIFSPSTPATSICFKPWLVYWIVDIKLLWLARKKLWFYDSQLEINGTFLKARNMRSKSFCARNKETRSAKLFLTSISSSMKSLLPSVVLQHWVTSLVSAKLNCNWQPNRQTHEQKYKPVDLL